MKNLAIALTLLLAGCDQTSQADKTAIQEINEARKTGAEISKKMGGRNRQIPNVNLEPDSPSNNK